MANTSSAKKAIRVSERKRKINLRKLSGFRVAKKAMLSSIAKGDVKTAETELSQAYKTIDKAAKENTIHKNAASRLKSQLAQAINQAKAK